MKSLFLSLKAVLACTLVLLCVSCGGPKTVASQEVTLERDGNKIYGVLYYPEGVKKAPLVVVSHGFGGTGMFLKGYADALVPLGYAVYCYDFCGGSNFSRSEGKTQDMSIFSEEKDLLAVLDGLAQDPRIDSKKKPVLIGESQGGMVSALAAGDYPDRFGKIFLVFPALCIKDDWLKMYPTLADMPEEVDFWGMKLGHAYLEGLYDLDVYGHISKYQGPVYIFHGDNDQVVPVKYSVEAEKAYKNATLTIYPGEGHGFSPATQSQTLDSIKELIK